MTRQFNKQVAPESTKKKKKKKRKLTPMELGQMYYGRVYLRDELAKKYHSGARQVMKK